MNKDLFEFLDKSSLLTVFLTNFKGFIIPESPCHLGYHQLQVQVLCT